MVLLGLAAPSCGGDADHEPVAVGASARGGAAEVGPDATTTAAPPTLAGVDFENFSYPGSFCARTEQGWPDPPASIVVTDGTSQPWGEDFWIGLHQYQDLRADLTGDGVEDAAVWLDCGAGASGQLHFIAVYAAGPDGPVLLDRLDHPLDAPGRVYPQIWDVAVDGAELVIRWEVYADTDAHCCPSATTTYRYQWDGEGFVVVEGPTPPAPIE